MSVSLGTVILGTLAAVVVPVVIVVVARNWYKKKSQVEEWSSMDEAALIEKAKADLEMRKSEKSDDNEGGSEK